MRSFQQFFAIVALTGLVANGENAFAHHSTSEYDETVAVELQGTIVSVFWRNPHIVIGLATNEDGKQTVWKLEGASLSAQRRRGIAADQIQVGDKVRVAGFASIRRDAHMIVDHMLLPSGRELLLRFNASPRWVTDDKTGVGANSGRRTAEVSPAEDIFRVWTWARAAPGWWFFGDTDKVFLTESARIAASEWNEFEDNPVLDCIAPGMPATMANPYPIEFARDGDNIILRQEEFDVVRTIHMGKNSGQSPEPSHLGYSVGRWQDGTLIVDTNHIDWPYFNRVGAPQSTNVSVRESFTLDSDAGRLNYELNVSDPQTLTQPFVFSAHWVWRPGEILNAYECTVE